MSVPQEVRIKRLPNGEGFRILALWGLASVTSYKVALWKPFLDYKGWMKAPRIWE